MCDGDKVELTVNFDICFQYPGKEGSTGYIRVIVRDAGLEFNYGVFEELHPEDGPSLYRFRHAFFRKAESLEAYVSKQLPKDIVDQMTRRYAQERI